MIRKRCEYPRRRVRWRICNVKIELGFLEWCIWLSITYGIYQARRAIRNRYFPKILSLLDSDSKTLSPIFTLFELDLMYNIRYLSYKHSRPYLISLDIHYE